MLVFRPLLACPQSERFLKRYLEYARTAVAPAVSRRAGETLAAEYVSLREEVRPADSGRPLLCAPATSVGLLPKLQLPCWHATAVRMPDGLSLCMRTGRAAAIGSAGSSTAL